MDTENKPAENDADQTIKSLQVALADSSELLAMAEAEKKEALSERDNALAAKKAVEDQLADTEKSLEQTKAQAEAYIRTREEFYKVELGRVGTKVAVEPNANLVPMFKGDERIEVHPTAVKSHIEAGWQAA